ncbi:TPA: sugar phosphate isomerase/epimerase [Candidatus Poribacteria bacterium]|nr:sugar phosphate isomerase/epimerase [Candidatus Poribacteria bacterium]
MKLGLVTYNMAKDWDIDTIIETCAATAFEGVELRTTHAHGVEVTLSADERRVVKRKFEESPVELCGLGSAFEYHAIDQDELRRNIEGTKEYAKLAHDVGASGIKVRPNGLQEEAGIPKGKTLEQIGLALRECGEFAKDYGVEIRLEVHGRKTSEVPNIRAIMDVANHDNVFVCWNSNQSDVDSNGSVKGNFELVKDWIRLVHTRDLYVQSYPWRELFALLMNAGYRGYCLAEIPGSSDPERVMNYCSALWRELCRQ